MQKEFPEIAEEIRGLLSQIKGVQKVSEELNLTYLVQIEAEEDREGVEKVGAALSDQAKGYGFALDVIPITEEEVKLAKEKMAQHIADQSTFKS